MYVVEKVTDWTSQREHKETEIESERTKGKIGREMKGRDGKLCNNPRSLLNHHHSAVRRSARQDRPRVDGQTQVPSAPNKILQKL